MLGSLFLFIASFSIIAGVMLLVNIFVMLADERARAARASCAPSACAGAG